MYSTFAIGKKTVDSHYENFPSRGKTSENDIDIDIKYFDFCHTDANLVHNRWAFQTTQ